MRFDIFSSGGYAKSLKFRLQEYYRGATLVGGESDSKETEERLALIHLSQERTVFLVDDTFYYYRGKESENDLDRVRKLLENEGNEHNPPLVVMTTFYDRKRYNELEKERQKFSSEMRLRESCNRLGEPFQVYFANDGSDELIKIIDNFLGRHQSVEGQGGAVKERP